MSSVSSSADSKAQLKAVIVRFHQQLMQGCGRPGCMSEHCASSAHSVKPANASAALQQAIKLAQSKEPFCDGST